MLKITPHEILDSHLLVFAAERARRENTVIDFAKFKEDCMSGRIID